VLFRTWSMLAALGVLVGCSASSKPPAPPTPAPTTEAAVATCAPQPDSNVPTPGLIIHLASANHVIETQVGFDVVVKPPRGDTSGRSWRLTVTAGAAHLCLVTSSKTGRLVATSIAEFRTLSGGSVSFEAVNEGGRTARATLSVS
jgi:hypothetical protein